MELPNLDYAFLAEFARVDPSGSLTAVGASFTLVEYQSLPMPFSVAIAGRIRMAENGEPVPLRLGFSGPTGATPRLEVGLLCRHDREKPYEGRVGILFAVMTNMLIVETGLHAVTIDVDDSLARTLKFDVRPPAVQALR